MAFVDLEKAFDRVPREVVWWALRKVGVDEWLVNVIKAMYVGNTTAVLMKGQASAEFEVKVGVHQGSVLSRFAIHHCVGSIVQGVPPRRTLGVVVR